MTSQSGAASQRRDDAFHPHEARALDQDAVALDAGNQLVHRVEMTGALAERIDSVLRCFSHREQARNAFCPRIRADFPVELAALRAHLAHVAEHEGGWRRTGGEDI